MADLRSARQKTKKQSLGALAKVKERKAKEPVPRTHALAALKKTKRGPALARIKNKQRKLSPHDFNINGVLYHSPKVTGYRGDSPFGTVNVTTGTMTYLMTNKAGSWMHPILGQHGHFKEPAALGLGSQLEVCSNLNARFGRYLKEQGILTAAQKRVQREMQEKAQRKRKRQSKSSLATLKARKQQN